MEAGRKEIIEWLLIDCQGTISQRHRGSTTALGQKSDITQLAQGREVEAERKETIEWLLIDCQGHSYHQSQTQREYHQARLGVI